MKTKRLFLLLAAFISIWGFELSAQTKIAISVYARIPLAPNIMLSVATERIPAPYYDCVWIDGYWAWYNPTRSYVWVEGYWAQPPYAGAYWIPGYWENTARGYVWMDAAWMPRDYRFNYGYYDGRFDYYGRPVYYHKPPTHSHHGYVYAYDHRSDYRERGYSSSPYYNSHHKPDKKNNRDYYGRQVQESNRRNGDDYRNAKPEAIANEGRRSNFNQHQTQPEVNDSRRNGRSTSPTMAPTPNAPVNSRQSSGQEMTAERSSRRSEASVSSSSQTRSSQSESRSSGSRTSDVRRSTGGSGRSGR